MAVPKKRRYSSKKKMKYTINNLKLFKCISLNYNMLFFNNSNMSNNFSEIILKKKNKYNKIKLNNKY